MRQYLVGAAASICNIAIHALVMVAVIKVTRVVDELATTRQMLRLIAVMIATVTVLMIAHLADAPGAFRRRQHVQGQGGGAGQRVEGQGAAT